MNPGVSYIPIIPNTTEWMAYRMNGIGASEVATLMGKNEWETPMRTFCEKVGLEPQRQFSNERTHWGKKLEPQILDSAQYWDGSKESYVLREENGEIYRRFYVPRGIFVNEKFPWLFITPDALGEPGPTLLGYETDLYFPLEAKNIDKLTLHKYGGLPPYYEYQIMTQMIVMESPYAEFAYLASGNEFKVEAREFNPVMAEEIISTTHDFWYSRVLPAREYARKLIDSKTIKEKRTYLGKIQALEPEADNTDAYRDYQVERFDGESGTILGDKEVFSSAKKSDMLKQIINKLEVSRRLYLNQLIQVHQHNNASIIDFGNGGKSSYNKKHLVSLKKDFCASEERVEKEISKLNLNY